MGVRIESSPEDVQTLEIQYTGLEDVDATAERLKAVQDPQGESRGRCDCRCSLPTQPVVAMMWLLQ